MELPDFLKNRRSATLNQRAQVAIGTSNPPHLSLMGNRFTLVDAAGAKRPVDSLSIDVIICDQLEHRSKIYYEEWDPNNPAPPICFSDNGIAPSINASEPQALRCDACPMNEWGSETSKVTGKGIKACKDQLKVAFFLPAEPDMVYLLRIPPNSLKNFGAYVGKFAGTGVDLTDAVTRVSFKQGVQGTLEFAGVSLIDQAMFDAREAILDSKRTDALVGRLDTPRTGALPTPAQAPQLQAPLQQAAQPIPTQPIAPSPVARAAAPTRRRRTKAEMEAARAAEAPQTAPAPAAAPTAPFRPATPPTAAPSGNGTLFGMAQGAEPPADVKSTLDNLFPQ